MIRKQLIRKSRENFICGAYWMLSKTPLKVMYEYNIRIIIHEYADMAMWNMRKENFKFIDCFKDIPSLVQMKKDKLFELLKFWLPNDKCVQGLTNKTKLHTDGQNFIVINDGDDIFELGVRSLFLEHIYKNHNKLIQPSTLRKLFQHSSSSKLMKIIKKFMKKQLFS
jgi:hypothetical protein